MKNKEIALAKKKNGLLGIFSSAKHDQAPGKIPINQIEIDPEQPRKEIGDLSMLVESIKKHGVLQPIRVEQAGARYCVVFGERRLRAATLAGLDEIPAERIEIFSEKHRRAVQIVENLHRKDLSPLERADAYHEILVTAAISQKELAEEIGVSPAEISKTLSLVELAGEIKDALASAEEQPAFSTLYELSKMREEEQISAWNAAKERVEEGGRMRKKDFEKEKRGRPKKDRDDLEEFTIAEDNLLPWELVEALGGIMDDEETTVEIFRIIGVSKLRKIQKILGVESHEQEKTSHL